MFHAQLSPERWNHRLPLCPAGHRTRRYAVCPARQGTVTGTIKPADVVGPTAQGIAPGDFAAFVAAIRAGKTYANVHTTAYPNAEIRG
ncbi:CHRD domain-containing protein [Streptomyces roseochromogenus]|uniref:CHRD domain-containing protein n=1 Tax=Streptomyces roseochromogenus TaxID=285450 RepID=UPI000AB0A560